MRIPAKIDPDDALASIVSGECSFCGEKATAYWHELSTISICPQCAVRILPALIADAIQFPIVLSYDSAKNVLVKVERNYWQAMASRLIAERKVTR